MSKVSIILPVYGVEKYIGDCVNSIVNQTFNDFELVIVNDSTKDKSIEIAESILKKTTICYKIVHRENGGLAAARNTGIQNASSEYLVFVDSDDVLNPRYLEILYTDISVNQNDLAIANFKWVSDEDKFDFDKRTISGKTVDKKQFLLDVIKRKVFPYFGCFIVKRDYILDNNLMFDESVLFNVDHAYQWYLMVNVSRYTYNPLVVYNYYVRPGSIMTGTSLKKKLTGLHSIEKCAYDLKDNGLIESELILTRYKAGLLHMIATQSELADFLSVYSSVRAEPIKLILYPDIKIKLLGFGTLLGGRFVYYSLRRIER